MSRSHNTEDRYTVQPATTPAPAMWRSEPTKLPLFPHARRQVHVALIAALEAVGGVPCEGRDEWLSEDSADRETAARLCTDCPVWAACDAAAADESWGVWAGLDRASPHAVARRRQRHRKGPAAA